LLDSGFRRNDEKSLSRLLTKPPILKLGKLSFDRHNVKKGKKPKSTASFPDDAREVGFGQFLITSRASDARRRGATTEAYGTIRRKEESASGGNATPQMMPCS